MSNLIYVDENGLLCELITSKEKEEKVNLWQESILNVENVDVVGCGITEEPFCVKNEIKEESML